MSEPKQTPRLSLKQWVNRVYVRSSMLQLVMVNLAFLLLLAGLFVLLAVNQGSQARKDQEQQLISALQAKTDWVNARLSSVQSSLQVFRRQAERMFYDPPPSDQQTPLVRSGQNVLMKPEDDGGAGVYYSSRSRDLSSRERKTRHLLPLSSVMADLQRANPLVKQVYLNTPDHLNLLYPYQDVTVQFAPDLDLTAFSFYYLADETHNPQRLPVWTDAYLDPAGLGWIISHIAPVYQDDTLEMVVGLDLTIESLISNLFALPQPWSGYAVLVGKDGNILALPPEGEPDFNLQELTEGQYRFRHLTTNEFKPELFNLYKRPEMAELSRLVAHQQAGLAQIELSQPSVVAWNTVPVTGWKLMAVTPQSELYADVTRLTDYLYELGTLACLFTLFILAVHFGIQRNRSRRLYLQMQKPLIHFRTRLEAGLRGQADPAESLQSPVSEIAETSSLIDDIVSEHQMLTQQLQQQKTQGQRQSDYFRRLLNGIPVPVFDADPDYRIMGCNRAFETFFGKSEAELKSRLLTEFIPVSLPEEGAFSRDLTLTNANDQSRHVSVLVACTSESSSGRQKSGGRSVIGLIIDLSEHYQIRDQMQFDRDRALEASQLQTEYLQAMRRELEPPLLGLASLAGQLSDQPQEHQRLGRELKEKIDALLYLTRDNWLPDDVRRPAERGDAQAAEKRARVLVVDDGPVNTMLAKSVLQKSGYEVDVVYSGEEALACQKEKPYQVVLMDIFMPEMDGIETTRRWRDAEQQLQLPPAAIIALTANVIESERQCFFDAGMNEYLAKPYHPSELRSRVDFWRQQYTSGQVSESLRRSGTDASG